MFYRLRHRHHRGEPITNFESDKPSSWYATLYQHDSLTGGHVIMLGQDDASRCVDATWEHYNDEFVAFFCV